MNRKTGFFVIIHSLAALSLFYCTPAAVAAFISMYLLTGFGITVGYHRLLAHHSFKTTSVLQNLLSTAGALAMEGGPLFWVSTHRKHHQFTDCEGDPHDSRSGFWWSHMGWIVASDNKLKYEPLVVGDLMHDRWLCWLERYYMHLQVILTLALLLFSYFVAGFNNAIAITIWAIPLRIVAVLHCTWLTNSAAHLWGYRSFRTNDRSTNNWWVALLTLGEGWHNNHHAYPSSARHGFRYWELDPSWWLIWCLGKFKLAWAIRIPKLTM